MANLGCIDINPWNSTIKNIENPDWLVIDIDTIKDKFEEVIQTALYSKLERSIKKRNNKIYVDYLQNKRGQTLAAPYSVGPVIGANIKRIMQKLEKKNTNKGTKLIK